MRKNFFITSLFVFVMNAFIFGQNINKDMKNIALKGYDPVSYFTMGKPVMGQEKYKYEYMEALWLFSSQENMEMFKMNPEKYTPQYGGYCAWAMAKGNKADIDPNVWKIVDGRLYLNYNKSIGRKWAKDIKGFIKKADEKWKKLIGKM